MVVWYSAAVASVVSTPNKRAGLTTPNRWTPAALSATTSLSCASRPYTTHAANSVVAGIAMGRMLGTSSGIALIICASDSPSCDACCTATTTSTSPVSVPSESRNTRTSSQKIIRFSVVPSTPSPRLWRGE